MSDNPIEMEVEPLKIIQELWQEHRAAPFPRRLRGREIDGIDFVMLDADIAGCVMTFLKQGSLDVFNTAWLGLCYRNACYVVTILYEEGVGHFGRLERLAELVLREIHRKSLMQS